MATPLSSKSRHDVTLLDFVYDFEFNMWNIMSS